MACDAILYIIVGTHLSNGEEFIPDQGFIDMRNKLKIKDLCDTLNATYIGEVSFEVAQIVPL